MALQHGGLMAVDSGTHDGRSPLMVVQRHGRRQREAAVTIVDGGGGDCQQEVATDRTAVSAGRQGRCRVLNWRTVRFT
jgi:hypothetical protein